MFDYFFGPKAKWFSFRKKRKFLLSNWNETVLDFSECKFVVAQWMTNLFAHNSQTSTIPEWHLWDLTIQQGNSLASCAERCGPYIAQAEPVRWLIYEYSCIWNQITYACNRGNKVTRKYKLQAIIGEIPVAHKKESHNAFPCAVKCEWKKHSGSRKSLGKTRWAGKSEAGQATCVCFSDTG